MILLIVRIILMPFLVIQVWQGVVSTYLALVAAASFFYKRENASTHSRSPERVRAESLEGRGAGEAGGDIVHGDRCRFLALIPAHNEEALLGRLLDSLEAVEYPRDCFDIAVVADNCTDSTAEIARRSGVLVFERFDAVAKGKGHALRWLMGQFDLDAYDAIFVVDADSIVSPNIFEAGGRAFSRGARLVQVYDGVHNRDESPAAGLRALAFDLHNRVRPMGQQVLGVSVGLMGNGMFISSELLHGDAWNSFGLAEDMEAHAKLVARGERVHYVDHAYALAEMPASLADSSGQNERWEAGRLDVARRHAPLLGLQAVRKRSWPKLATAIDVSVPPQSAQIMLAVAGLVGSMFIGPPLSFRLAVWTAVAQATYHTLGLARLGRRGASLRVLLHAPAYVLWKGGLYLRVLTGRGPTAWTRGHRVEALPERETADVAG